MNIGKFFNESLGSIRNSDSRLRQILILSALGVIILGFGNRGNILPVNEGSDFLPDYGGYRPEEDGISETEGSEPSQGNPPYDKNIPSENSSQRRAKSHNERRSKHRHHHKHENKVFPSVAEVQDSGSTPLNSPNSPEVPYIIE